MKNLLLCFAVLPFLAGVAPAAQPLSDEQMDRIAAGASPSASVALDLPCTGICSAITSTCPGCTGGELFVPPPIGAPLLPALYAFLNSVGYQPMP